MNTEKFKKVNQKFAPVPFWSWNDKLNDDELCRQIEEMADKGMGGFFMHPRVGLLTAYNTPEWFHSIDTCVKKAKEVGIDAWLYDEDRWPSGYGSGEVTIHEEYRSRALLLLEEHEITADDTILDTYDDKGIEYFIVKRVAPMGDEWYNGTNYADLMNKNAVRKFLDVTHERYKEHNGEYFGKEIPGIFTDEPNYIIRNNYKSPALPWSDYLEDFFFERHGYNLKDNLKELFFNINDYRKIRHDFFDSASNLLLESFTKQYYNWCDENNLKMVGHFMAEDSMHYQISWTGFIMPHYEFMHYPGIDKLGRRVNQNITVKQLSTVAEQLNKERALSEVYGCIGQDCGFKERKWIIDWQAVLGVTFVNPHLSLYSMRGERKRDFPANLYYQQPYWKEEKAFSDYVARISELVSQGKRETKILLIHAVASAWCEFDPRPGIVTPYDAPFNTIVDLLIEENLDFHFGDESILQNHAKAQNGEIVINDYAYSTVIVPPSCTLKRSTVDLLTKMAQEGGGENIIFIHPYPTRIDGSLSENYLPEKTYKTTKIEKAVEYVSEFFKDRVKTIDYYSGQNAKKIYTSSKIIEDEKIVLFANIEKTRQVKSKLIITDKRSPYLLDLASGDIFELPFERNGDEIHISAKFYAAGSLAILFTDKAYKTKKMLYNTDTGVSFYDGYKAVSKCEFKGMKFNEANVMPVNYVTMYIDGKLAAENMPLSRIWNEYFYRKPDGTKFACEYEFTVNNWNNEKMTAAIECAQNLDNITLNGHRLTPKRAYLEPEVYDEAVNYKDVSFVKVSLEGIKNGKNILRIEGIKVNNTNGYGGHYIIKDFKNYHSTELDAIYILGDFKVTEKDNSDFEIDFTYDEVNHKDLTGSGYPFYAGNVKYTYEVDYKKSKKQPFLRLNTANCSYAKVFVNGKLAGYKYMRPFIYDIDLKDGKNIIEIEFADTLFNLMGPNWIDGLENIDYISPEVFKNFEKYTDKYKFMPLGIKSVEIVE